MMLVVIWILVIAYLFHAYTKAAQMSHLLEMLHMYHDLLGLKTRLPQGQHRVRAAFVPWMRIRNELSNAEMAILQEWTKV